MGELTHFNEQGRARMVDVTEKAVTHRRAAAAGEIHVSPETMTHIKNGTLKKGDVLIIFHNIGINPATIDAAREAYENGVHIIAVSSSQWQTQIPADHFIRHPSGKNLFDFAEVCIDDYNPVGDAVVRIDGLDAAIAPVSNIVDFYIAHQLEIATVKECIRRGVKPPVWNSANVPGGDEKNRAYLEKYDPRIKML